MELGGGVTDEDGFVVSAGGSDPALFVDESASPAYCFRARCMPPIPRDDLGASSGPDPLLGWKESPCERERNDGDDDDDEGDQLAAARVESCLVLERVLVFVLVCVRAVRRAVAGGQGQRLEYRPPLRGGQHSHTQTGACISRAL